jgi:hypothetical protein
MKKNSFKLEKSPWFSLLNERLPNLIVFYDKSGILQIHYKPHIMFVCLLFFTVLNNFY